MTEPARAVAPTGDPDAPAPPDPLGPADPAGPPDPADPLTRLRRTVPQLLLIGLAVHLLVPQITSLQHALQVMRAMNGGLVGLAVAAQVASYVGTGYMVKSLVAVAGRRIGIARGVAVTLAASSVGMVAAGALGYAAATFRWLAQDVGEEAAGLTAALTPLLNNAVLLGVAVLGVAGHLARFSLTPEQTDAFDLLLAALVVAVAAAVAVARHPLSLAAAVDRVADRWATLRRRPPAQHHARERVARFVATAQRLRHGGWRRPMLGASLNIAFDMLTLWLLFAAGGHAVGGDVLLVGYGVPILLGKVSFLPGGIGMVEATMTALYSGLGVPPPIIVVVVLGYRLLSFWLPFAIGFPLIPLVQRPSRA